MKERNGKHYWVAVLIGNVVFVIYILSIYFIAPIVGLTRSGNLYELLNFLDVTIGAPYTIASHFTNFLGCVTSPCMVWDIVFSIIIYALFGILVYKVVIFCKNYRTKK